MLRVLERSSLAPLDLREKALYLAGQLLELCGKAEIGEGIEMARKVLDSGDALTKFLEIVRLQGGKEISSNDISVGKFSKTFYSNKSGRITFVNDDEIARIAKLLGAPLDKGAGIYLHKTIDDYVGKGEALFTVYAESKRLLEEGCAHCKKEIIYNIK